MNTHLPIESLELSVRSFNCLKRAGINTLCDLWALLDEGVDFRKRIRNTGHKSIREVLCKAQKMGYPSDKAVMQHIEKIKSNQVSASIHFWEDLYEALISDEPEVQPLLNGTPVSSLDNMPVYFAELLERNGIRTVEELLSRHKSEDTLPFTFLLAPSLIRILHKNGYRFSECTKEKWPNIEDYIMSKRAMQYSVDRLYLPQNTRESLKTAGITIATIVNENYAFLADYLNNAQIAQLLFALDDFDLRTKDTQKNTHPDIVSFVVDNIEIPTADLGLSPQIYNSLHDHSIDVLSKLLKFSRRELIERKIVNLIAIPELVHTLHNYRVHLKGDIFHECTCCKTAIAVPKSHNETYYCVDCANRLNRIQQIKNYVVTLSEPDYGRYTDGTEGFTIFATVHNKANKLVEVKLVEFMLYRNGRQWVPSKTLTGYSFSTEYIMPNSSKTSAKIWSGFEWEDQELSTGDYINFSFSIDGQIYAYKFVLKDDEFEIDDYFSY